jgi:YVTN family beta-propeller protein
VLGLAASLLALSAWGAAHDRLLPAAFAGPAGEATNSTPIAITSDNRFLWVANPQNNSVSLIQVANDVVQLIQQIPVGKEPQCVAITPNDKFVYVTNMVDGTVSVINANHRRVTRTIRVGTEPFGCALTPDGTRLFVANQSSDTVSVINTQLNKVIATVPVEPKPRGIGITATSGKVYVTHWLAQLRDNGRPVDQNEGRDDGEEGRVTVLSAANNSVLGSIALDPLANTGFTSNGSTLDRIAPTNPPTFNFVTGCFPNLLQSLVVKGDHAYLPNTGSSPNGPLRFNVNVQALISVIDLDQDQDAGLTVNMNSGVQFETVGKKLFITNPLAIAFKRNADEGFVVSAATNRVVRVVLDAQGKPSINAPVNAQDPGNIIRIEVGKNPRGIVLNSTDTRAYTMNFISRDVSVLDIQTGSPNQFTEIARVAAAGQPNAGTLAAIIHRGEELFDTSIGPAGTQENSLPPAGRMSDFGWGTCYSCHPEGLADGVTWMFGDGPRQSISMESTFAHPQPPGTQLNPNGAPLAPSSDQHVLNWSAVRDEIQDFELNIRAVSGGQGLIRLANGAQDPCVFNLVIPPGNDCPANTATNAGRDADLDAIAAYIAFGIRAPISPLRARGSRVDPDVKKGRKFFEQANCQQCHGGAKWSRSRVDFAPPPAAAQINNGQLFEFLTDVGTFDPAAFNELNPNLGVANGGLGINVPSLLTVNAGAPYFHSGQAQSLDEVLNNVAHRSAGTNGTDTLTDPQRRARLAKFLKSIDAKTVPFP